VGGERGSSEGNNNEEKKEIPKESEKKTGNGIP